MYVEKYTKRLLNISFEYLEVLNIQNFCLNPIET